MKKPTTFLFTCVLFLSACQVHPDAEKAETVISGANMEEYVKTLGSDEFLGRKPFTEGEEKTLAYLEKVFSELGLEPGFGQSWYQEVPMVEVSVFPSDTLLLTGPGIDTLLRYRDDFVVTTRRLVYRVWIEEAPLVFAGYGIVAPEYGWNDYAGLDVKGKIVMVLVNDPGYATGDPELFKGREMTYYGRWTYKYEEAARQGALGLMIVHETGAAGYDWSVVHNGAVIPNLYLKPEDKYLGWCAIEGWFTQQAAQSLVRMSGADPDSLFAAAAKPDFVPRDLAPELTLEMFIRYRFDVSRNIMGMIRGSERPGEAVVYSAHWDHLGVGAPVNGDSIYNGAVDNGTSLAWMLEIARAFKALEKPPQRTVLFLAPTAEEQGLLGAMYYTQHPVIPMERTVADINNDLLLPMGRMKDVMVTGAGQSELEDYVEKYAKKQGRYLQPDPNPHTGMYFRADHFAFAKAGVPALFVRGNVDHREKGKEYAAQQEQDYLQNRYHQPADEYDPETWDFSGIVEDARLMFRVGLELANSDVFPAWKEGSEFASVRNQSFSGKQIP
ncbi:MAG TPA: M28 family peptidase [Bacteroidetes bacterium]|nr:M28 family peptidase [Bacteroidota bacterium]